MLEKSKYNLVDDSVDARIPADNEGQFQHGLTFEVKVRTNKSQQHLLRRLTRYIILQSTSHCVLAYK